MLRRIDRVVVRVPGLPAAVAYYRDVLGMTLLHHDNRIASFQLDARNRSELILHTDPDLPAEGVYWLVDDVRALYRQRAELKLVFTTPPTQIARGYRAQIRDPFGTVLLVLDRTTESQPGDAKGKPAVVEDAKSPGMLFGGIVAPVAPKRDLLLNLYQLVGRTADDLPYTPHFETIYKDYILQHAEPGPTREEVWRHLLNLRKGGKLPKLGEARSKPPEITAEEKSKLKAALGDAIGRRDRLPYTARFDKLVDDFNRTQGRPLSPHLVWRLVATLAK